MRRIIKAALLIALALVMALGAVACTDKEDPLITDNAVYYTVKFSTAGGTEIDSVNVKEGGYITEPKAPEKPGYIFDGWRTNEGKWFFDVDKVTTNVTLNAIWISEKTVFEYELKDEKATITKYIGEIRELVIPETLGGFPVVAIADKAFYQTSFNKTTSITIGENILSIGNSAFYDCPNVDIKVNAKPTSIGEKAFYGCTGLTAITLGQGLESVPFEAFSGCTALTSVVLPDTVSSISENAFELCTSLKSITAHSTLKSVEDCAFAECDAFVAVYLYGEDTDFENIEVAEGNNGNVKFKAAKVYLYSETEPTENKGKYWHYDDIGKIRIW